MKNIANSITGTRILASLCIVCIKPMSVLFWVLYFYCFISDILDGYIARKMKITSEMGALLDSVADTIFFFTVCISLLPFLVLSQEILWWIGIIILLRVTSYLIGFIKYRSFSSLHTWLNKITGFLLCLSPLLFVFISYRTIDIIVGGLAFLSALEELLITISSKQLDRDIKSVFIK